MLLLLPVMENKTQLGPRVDGSLADEYRNFVRFVNDGTYKGRLGNEVEKALRYQMAFYFVRHPEELDRAANSEFIEDDEFVDKMMDHIDGVGPQIVKAAENLRSPETQQAAPVSNPRTYQPSSGEIPASERLIRSRSDTGSEDEVLRRIEQLERKIEDYVTEE